MELTYFPPKLDAALESKNVQESLDLVRNSRSKFEAVEELQKSGGVTIPKLKETVGDIHLEFLLYCDIVGLFERFLDSCYMELAKGRTKATGDAAIQLGDYLAEIEQDVERIKRYNTGVLSELSILLEVDEIPTPMTMENALHNYFTKVSCT